MANFVETVYELDERIGVSGRRGVVRIRVEGDVLLFETTEARENEPDSDPPDLDIHIPSSASRDAGWGRPRGVRIAWTGSPPQGYAADGRLFIPILQPSRFSEYKVGQTGTFRGASFIIVGKLPEVIRS